MVYHNLSKLDDVVSKISYVKLITKFSQETLITKGSVSIHSIEGLKKPLEFEIEIYPQYPLKNHSFETIKFINKDLLEYNHVMGDGSICIHTPHSPIIESKLITDFNSLKAWIIKYYLNKDKDPHYEHIIIHEQIFEGKYYSYQFTDVDYSFSKGEYGEVNLTHMSSGVYKGYPISNLLVKAFNPINNLQIYCKWSEFYMNLNSENNSIGLFVFLDETPAIYNRFAFGNWLQLKNFLPEDFLNFLYAFQNNNIKKHYNSYFPIFLGYKTVNNEVHWISTTLKMNELPIKGSQVKNSTGEKLKGQWQSQLIDKEINWAITRNSSYQYLFGRGAFCNKITNSKILIIGLGAIGSSVAKILVKCGAKDISLVDFDVKEPENVCRSEYDYKNGLYDKTAELMKIVNESSPFVNVKYLNNNDFFETYIKILHKDKEERKKYESSISKFDIIFNCSADSDLMYVLDQLKLNADLINLSITNHAKDLVCAFYPNIYKFVQNQFINVLKNDVEDLYNPTGCWSPTFKASYNDINLLVQCALKEINSIYLDNKPKDNFTISTSGSEIKKTEY